MDEEQVRGVLSPAEWRRWPWASRRRSGQRQRWQLERVAAAKLETGTGVQPLGEPGTGSADWGNGRSVPQVEEGGDSIGQRSWILGGSGIAQRVCSVV